MTQPYGGPGDEPEVRALVGKLARLSRAQILTLVNAALARQHDDKTEPRPTNTASGPGK